MPDQLLNNKDLQFDEQAHKYWLKSNPDLKFTSSTTFISKFFEVFNAPKIASKLVRTHPKYKGMSVSDLLKQWNKTATHGTKVHNQVEDYILGELEYDELTELKAIHAADWIDTTFDPNRHELYPEVQIYSRELQLSGTVDLVAYDKQKDIYLLADWKTNKKITKTAYKGKTGTHKATLKVEDCKFNKYALQMSLYRYMLEREYGIAIKRQVLVHLFDKGKKFYYTPYMKDIITEMIKECPL